MFTLINILFEINKNVLSKCLKQTILKSQKGKDPFTVRYDYLRKTMENDETEEYHILSAGETLRHQYKHTAAPAWQSEYQHIYIE